MSKFRVQVTGTIAYKRFRNYVGNAIEEVYIPAFEAQTKNVLYDTDKNHKKKHIFDRWKVKYYPYKGFFIEIEDSDYDYALIAYYVDKGTKKHMIPNKEEFEMMRVGIKQRHFLRFPVRDNKSSHKPIPGNISYIEDGYVYTMAVIHPGIKARRFVDDIFTDPILFDRFITIIFDYGNMDVPVKYMKAFDRHGHDELVK